MVNSTPKLKFPQSVPSGYAARHENQSTDTPLVSLLLANPAHCDHRLRALARLLRELDPPASRGQDSCRGLCVQRCGHGGCTDGCNDGRAAPKSVSVVVKDPRREAHARNWTPWLCERSRESTL